MDCMQTGREDGTVGRIGLVLAMLLLALQPLAAQSAIGLPSRTYIITADVRDAHEPIRPCWCRFCPPASCRA
ncbi:MAG: hypothetical protein M1530_02205 [Candidatus Marsarchaeota archaeon]|nr:hypothetical protein [Candidatus Marsarchaeota archaeon]